MKINCSINTTISEILKKINNKLSNFNTKLMFEINNKALKVLNMK